MNRVLPYLRAHPKIMLRLCTVGSFCGVFNIWRCIMVENWGLLVFLALCWIACLAGVWAWSWRLTEEATKEILRCLNEGENSGKMLRILIDCKDLGVSGPRFYGIMAELEKMGVVTSWDNCCLIAGEFVKDRWFRLSGGKAA